MKVLGKNAGILAIFWIYLISAAHGELVYENDSAEEETSSPSVPTVYVRPAKAGNADSSTRSEDRQSTRQALSVSEKAQATAQQSVESKKSSVQGEASGEAPNASKSELLRRERVREELKNEDALQERLEELRLRDEHRRTEQILNPQAGGGSDVGTQPSNAAPVSVTGPVQSEVVTAPVTDKPGSGSSQASSRLAGNGPHSASTASEDSLAYSQATVGAPATESTESSEKIVIRVQPRAGFSNMNVSSAFDVRPHYSLGLGLELGVSDHISFEVGYQYSEYGVRLNNTGYGPAGSYYDYLYGQNYRGFESVSMKQNVVDAGFKFHFLGPDAKLRPYIGGGAAYAKSFVNLDSRVLNYLRSVGMDSSDYTIDSFLGFLSAGMDVRVSKSIAIGANFKYYTVLSARESENLYYGAFAPGYYQPYGANPYGGYPGYPGYGGYGAYPNYPGYPASPTTGPDRDKLAAGSSLAQSSFYTITGAVSFAF